MKNKDLVEKLNARDPEAEVLVFNADAWALAPLKELIDDPESNTIELLAGEEDEEQDDGKEPVDELFEEIVRGVD